SVERKSSRETAPRFRAHRKTSSARAAILAVASRRVAANSGRIDVRGDSFDAAGDAGRRVEVEHSLRDLPRSWYREVPGHRKAESATASHQRPDSGRRAARPFRPQAVFSGFAFHDRDGTAPYKAGVFSR